MAWGVVFYRTKSGRVPAEDFLSSCPDGIESRIEAVLEAVRAAPPPAFSGGGMWEAMHGKMKGYYEIRVSGPGKIKYRLFCLLDSADEKGLANRGFEEPQIAAINGMKKPPGETFSEADYRKHVKTLGDDYLKTLPRRIAT